jgi:hypothetical protein
MTNNKQQTAVKLYTEEQVREIIERAELNQHLTYGDVLDGIFPIELPSDIQLFDIHDKLYFGHSIDWIIGAIWMRDKIRRR